MKHPSRYILRDEVNKALRKIWLPSVDDNRTMPCTRAKRVVHGRAPYPNEVSGTGFLDEFIGFCYTEEAERLGAGLSSALRTS